MAAGKAPENQATFFRPGMPARYWASCSKCLEREFDTLIAPSGDPFGLKLLHIGGRFGGIWHQRIDRLLDSGCFRS